MHVNGLTRAETEHVLDSFLVVRKYEMRDHGEYRTRRLVLEAYDRMAAVPSLAAAPAGHRWPTSPPATAPATDRTRVPQLAGHSGHGQRHNRSSARREYLETCEAWTHVRLLFERLTRPDSAWAANTHGRVS